MNTPPRRTWGCEDCESTFAGGLESSSFVGLVCWPTVNASGARANTKKPIRADIRHLCTYRIRKPGIRVTDFPGRCGPNQPYKLLGMALSARGFNYSR